MVLGTEKQEYLVKRYTNKFKISRGLKLLIALLIKFCSINLRRVKNNRHPKQLGNDVVYVSSFSYPNILDDYLGTEQVR